MPSQGNSAAADPIPFISFFFLHPKGMVYVFLKTACRKLLWMNGLALSVCSKKPVLSEVLF
jgi:hypothetical protein